MSALCASSVARTIIALSIGSALGLSSDSSAAADFDCVIEPRQVLEIRSPIEGLIERVNVDRGDYVVKGQVIAVLDSSIERAAATLAKQRAQMDSGVVAGHSRVELSTRKLERAQELQKQNFVSAQARDEAAAEKKLADAELSNARDNKASAELEYQRQEVIIRHKTIRSPIAGVVIERILNVGELAEAGVGRKPILKLAEVDTLHVEVVLPAEAYGSLKLGTAVEVMPSIANGAIHRATIKVIDRVLDAASGTYGVRLELPNPRRMIPAGIRCTARFPTINKALRSTIRSAPLPH
jgi:RND family efflux transporter MFP subunit